MFMRKNADGTLHTSLISQSIKGGFKSSHAFAIAATLTVLVFFGVVVFIVNNPKVKGIKTLIEYSDPDQTLKFGIDVEKDTSKDSSNAD